MGLCGEGRHNLNQGFELAVRQTPVIMDCGLFARVPRAVPGPGLVVSSRRGAADRTSNSWSCVTRSEFLNARSTAAPGTGPLTAPSWLPSAGSSPGTLASLPGHAGDAAPLAPRSRTAQVAGMAAARGPGRPALSAQLVKLIVRLGRENRSWAVCASRVSWPSSAPGPGRRRCGACSAAMAWDQHRVEARLGRVPQSQANGILATDFFTVGTVLFQAALCLVRHRACQQAGYLLG